MLPINRIPVQTDARYGTITLGTISTSRGYINCAESWYYVRMSTERDSARPGVQTVHIGSDLAGQRIDNFLLTRLKGAPRSLVYRILRRGEVRVNRGRVRPSYRLTAGDSIRIPPLRLAVAQAVTPDARVLNRIRDSILYEDGRLLIIDKPSGIAVHGGSGLSYGVIEALRALRPEAPFLELAHRLDRDTSGCLLIAKRRSALRRVHALLREGAVEKRYLALVCGAWAEAARSVDLALRKNVLSSGERMVRVAADGKAALTEFLPTRRFADAALLDVRLHTGRTHQIRVHAAHIGHPVAGDDKYGDAACNARLRALGLRRLFLHARSLRFEMPEDGQRVEVSAPLEPALARLLERLEATP